jgi:hypothetical protein
MTPSLTVAPIKDYAIIVDPKDNVAVVKTETFEGSMLSCLMAARCA